MLSTYPTSCESLVLAGKAPESSPKISRSDLQLGWTDLQFYAGICALSTGAVAHGNCLSRTCTVTRDGIPSPRIVEGISGTNLDFRVRTRQPVCSIIWLAKDRRGGFKIRGIANDR